MVTHQILYDVSRCITVSLCIADVSGNDVSEKMYRVLPVRRRVTDCIGCIAPKEGSDTLYRCIAHSQSNDNKGQTTTGSLTKQTSLVYNCHSVVRGKVNQQL